MLSGTPPLAYDQSLHEDSPITSFSLVRDRDMQRTETHFQRLIGLRTGNGTSLLFRRIVAYACECFSPKWGVIRLKMKRYFSRCHSSTTAILLLDIVAHETYPICIETSSRGHGTGDY
jgi:hypothetical protein